jgi:hypothetical protein
MPVPLLKESGIRRVALEEDVLYFTIGMWHTVCGNALE